MPLNPYNLSMTQEVSMPRIPDVDDMYDENNAEAERHAMETLGITPQALERIHNTRDPFQPLIDAHKADAEAMRQAEPNMIVETLGVTPDHFRRYLDDRATQLSSGIPDNATVELYARVGYTYTKAAGWSHKDATVSAKISGVQAEDSDWQMARVGEHLKTLSVLSEQHASAEITRRNQLGADGPTSEIVAGDAQGVSGEA